MKVTLCIISSGDGSAYVEFFKNEKLAEKRMESEGERLCDDIYTVNLPFDESKVKFCKDTEWPLDRDEWSTPNHWEGQLISK